MGRLFFLILAVIWGSIASAQSWEMRSDDNGVYAVASALVQGAGLSFTCHARSVQNLPLVQTGWHEDTIAPPYHFRVGFSDTLIPPTTGVRDDLILFVDQTGYQLPRVTWNDLVGSWEVILPMSDAMFAAMNTATRVVLQVGSQAAWEFPVAQLEASVRAAGQFCAATWVRIGHPPPTWFGPVVSAPAPATPDTFTMPPQVQAFANGQCNGPAQISSDALQAGDLDGDGTPDVVMNWRGVLCPGERISGFCGAANCSIDVFVSSRGYARPFQMLGTSAGIGPARTGGLALQVNGTYGLCGQTGCDAPWVWTGSTFEQQP